MNYFERYLNGEYEQVWNELYELGSDIRNDPYYTQAWQVAVETMQRVRRNCETLISRLNGLGYVFGTFPDGSRYSYTPQPITFTDDAMEADCAELEESVGVIPVSLKAFWQEVGSVDFVGMHPNWQSGLDPLVVDPPEGALSFLYDEEEDTEELGQFFGLAPDDLHKDNTSGGDPYGVRLPNSAMDFSFLYERHNLLFVPYLRLAILRWGGFPGLDGENVEFEPLAYLTSGLEPF
jgi:hypothetical protein